MANTTNPLDILGESLATLLARSVSDGTYDDVIGTLKVDSPGNETAATGIATAAGQLWSNLMDDYMQASYPYVRNVAGVMDATIGAGTYRGVNMRWPAADGTAGYVLSTDGAGQMSWVSATAETWADTLAAGAASGGTDPLMTDGDSLLWHTNDEGSAGTAGNWTTARQDDFTSGGGGGLVAVGSVIHTRAPSFSAQDLVLVNARGTVRVDDAGSTDVFTFNIHEEWSLDNGGGGGSVTEVILKRGIAGAASGTTGRPEFAIDSNAISLFVDKGSSATAVIDISAVIEVDVVIGGVNA